MTVDFACCATGEHEHEPTKANRWQWTIEKVNDRAVATHRLQATPTKEASPFTNAIKMGVTDADLVDLYHVLRANFMQVYQVGDTVARVDRQDFRATVLGFNGHLVHLRYLDNEVSGWSPMTNWEVWHRETK